MGEYEDNQFEPAPVEMPLPPLPRPPFWLMAAFLIMVVVSWVPLAVIARARVSTSDQPRIQILQDMGTQPKYMEQATDGVFLDGRADRGRVPGVVSWEHLDADDHYFRGFSRSVDPATGNQTTIFFDGFPKRVTVDDKLVERGRQRFNIYCYVCHGYDGMGHGPVNEVAMSIQEAGTRWTPAASLQSDLVRSRPDGHIFNTITNGIRNMPPYGTQIPVADRWAIIAYVRALELSQGAPAAAFPKEMQSALPAK